MQLIDVTRAISAGMEVYPSNPEVVYEELRAATDTTSALTQITLGSHTGTHIDAPSHIHAQAAGTGSYGLDQLIGACEVIEVAALSVITKSDLPPTTHERVLIKTKNSVGDPSVFDPEFVALDESAARELVSRGVNLVGIDGPSIKKKGVQDATHALLLDAGVIIIENLWLKEAVAGEYELLCLPLHVDLDGAPARVVLRA